MAIHKEPRTSNNKRRCGVLMLSALSERQDPPLVKSGQINDIVNRHIASKHISSDFNFALL
jgi:hypothetical protein